MPDTAEAWAREIVAQWLDHGADMLGNGPHERAVITEGLVTPIASAITASAEAVRERAAQAAENNATISYPDGSQASWTVWRPMIAAAIRALPLSGDEHEKEQL